MRLLALAAVPVAMAIPVLAQPFECAEPGIPPELVEIYQSLGVPDPPPEPEYAYAHLHDEHRLEGTACYYSDFFEGRRTASGERFRHEGFTAAHRTLPLGTWVEVTSKATGRKLRLKVNDRGPFKGGFVLDLSKAAAQFLGVDRARDRRVTMRVLALPGEKPPAAGPVPVAEAAN
jgi:rare lipoprotein A